MHTSEETQERQKEREKIIRYCWHYTLDGHSDSNDSNIERFVSAVTVSNENISALWPE